MTTPVRRPREYYETVTQYGPDAWDPVKECLRPEVLAEVAKCQQCSAHRRALEELREELRKNGNAPAER